MRTGGWNAACFMNEGLSGNVDGVAAACPKVSWDPNVPKIRTATAKTSFFKRNPFRDGADYHTVACDANHLERVLYFAKGICL